MTTYKIHAIFSNNVDAVSFGQKDFGLQEAVPIINNSHASWIQDFVDLGLKAYYAESPQFIFKLRGDIYCRETMIYYMRTIYNSYYAAFKLRDNAYGEIAFAVDIFTSSDDSATLAYEKGMEIFQRFELKRANMYLYRISIDHFRFVIKMGSYVRDCLLTSAMLYILHKPVIVQQILQNDAPRNVAPFLLPGVLWKLISKGFLKDEDWGDTYNSNIGLSVFFYVMGTEISHIPSLENGPSNYGVNVPSTILMEYIRKIFIPTLPEVHRISYDRWHFESDNHIKVFNLILSGIRSQE